MKKILLFILIIFVLLLGRCRYKSNDIRKNHVKLIGIKIPKEAETLELNDSHGGFHGDGVYYEEIQLEKEIVNEFASNALEKVGWRKLPMSKELHKLIFGERTVDYSYGGRGEMIPNYIKHGIFYYKDKKTSSFSDDSVNLYDSSHNFIFSILDFETGKLYILEFDS